MLLLRPAFRQHGKHFHFDPDGLYSFNHIEVGNYVSIGRGAVFVAQESEIIIGNHVMFAPDVTIRGGNHNISVVGKFMTQVREKRPEDDIKVVIEDDVWVGSNVTILKGVTVGRGSVIGAGAVVTKNIPPYAIVAGVPAKVIRFRFDVPTILKHEAALYKTSDRLSEAELLNIQKSFEER